MALGLQTESSAGGDFAKIIKFDARAGRMFRVDREQDAAGNYASNNVEITNGFQAVMDLENIEVGWALFNPGQAPSFALAKIGNALPARPSDQHKQAFRMNMLLGKASGGDVRELAAQAKCIIASVDELHTDYEKGKAANAGKLPVVKLTGSKAVVSGQGAKASTNYQPVWEIVKWVDRPAELQAKPDTSVQPSGPVQQVDQTTADSNDEF